MDLKLIQKKLEHLRDRIRAEGRLSQSSEGELKTLMENTLLTAQSELTILQAKLGESLTLRARNDNNAPALTEDQKKRLSFLEKSGMGSGTLH